MEISWTDVGSGGISSNTSLNLLLIQDFSTRSLVVSEESPIQMLKRQVSKEEEETKDDTVIQKYQMRRTWETRLGV
jgi:hypothetical protein